MTSAVLVALFGAAGVLAQSQHCANGYGYLGCSSVDLSCFVRPAISPGGSITPEACQQACQGHRFAALLPGVCLCGDDARAVNQTRESDCDRPCAENLGLGMCGGASYTDGLGVANVFGWVSVTTLPGPGPVTLGTAEAVSLPTPVASTTCSPSQDQASVPNVSAPPQEDQFTSCLEHDGSVTQVPTPSQLSQLPPSQAYRESPYDTAGLPYPTTILHHEQPEYVSIEVSEVCHSLYNGSEDDTHGVDCTLTAAAKSDPPASDQTLWPRPPQTADPTAQTPTTSVVTTPIPSVVTGSDSTHPLMPPFSALGVLALMAAVMM